MTGYAELLLAHGYTVLRPDARAHGLSGGELATMGCSNEKTFTNGLISSWRWHARDVFTGWANPWERLSCCNPCRKGLGFCAVVAESPFSTFREIAYDRMGQPFHAGPWVGRILLRPVVEIAFLRVHWKYGLDTQRVLPEDAVARAHIPILLIHGQIDRNIPYGIRGRSIGRLRSVCFGRCRVRIIAGRLRWRRRNSRHGYWGGSTQQESTPQGFLSAPSCPLWLKHLL
jgi:pimeloyl-ACP methyl ester carboxylesterase